MNVCNWIVCERGGRWTPAFRIAFARNRRDPAVRHQLREVRHLAELTAAIVERPNRIAAVEIHRGNFADALDWFAAATHQFPDSPCIALVDRSLARPTVINALREAGAVDVATSPRQLLHLTEFGARHSAANRELARNVVSDFPSLAARAWASLPWQDA